MALNLVEVEAKRMELGLNFFHKELLEYFHQLREMIKTESKIWSHAPGSRIVQVIIKANAQLLGMMSAISNPSYGFAKLLVCLFRMGSLTQFECAIRCPRESSGSVKTDTLRKRREFKVLLATVNNTMLALLEGEDILQFHKTDNEIRAMLYDEHVAISGIKESDVDGVRKEPVETETSHNF